ncbi:MAG: hypothetical protein ACI4D8_07790, partial [Wujia sp.]
MKNYEKGSYGYINNYKKKKLLVTLVLLVIILFIVVTMIIMFGDTKRVGIIFAILLSLPFAKYAIAFFMCSSFSSMSREEYDRIEESTKTSQGKMLYDVVITQYEGMKFYSSMCIKNGKIYALVINRKKDFSEKEYEKWIMKAIEGEKYKFKVTIFTDIDSYIKKIN